METLGRYQILGELGRGGCGIVYAAMDPRIGRKVAIKTIHSNLQGGDGDSYRERLRREAHSAGVLSHANIVTIHEFDEMGDLTYIVMEYVEGETLAQKMKGQQLSVEFIISFLRQAADALDFAHSQNIVHRDVKPGNFLITPNGLVKVADFGIAKAIGTESDLTRTGTVVGTVHYMSPEQVSSRVVSGRSDQFSLAVIAYEMTTGKKPFQGDSWASILHQIVTANPPPVKQYRASLGDSVTMVLRKGLAKDPIERYPNCKEFADELNRAIFNTTAERTLPLPVEEALKRPLPPPRENLPDTETETEAIPQPVEPAALPVNASTKRRSRWLPIAITAAAALAAYGGWLAYRSWTANPPDATPSTASISESKPPQASPPPAEPSPPPVAVVAPPEAPKTLPPEPVAVKADKLPKTKERPVTSAAAVSPKKAVPTPAQTPPRETNPAPTPVVTAPPDRPAVDLSAPVVPAGKYRGPPEGRFAWTGTLGPSARLTIGGNRASAGSVGGRGLPPVAVTAQADPATIQVVQQPSASNNFQLILRNTGAADVSTVNISWRENKD